MERLTTISPQGGLAFTFDLDVTCEPSEIRKIQRLGEPLKAYEDTGVTPEQIVGLKRFKDFFTELYGEGLEVANWHRNGDTEPFDSFYDWAENLMSE